MNSMSTARLRTCSKAELYNPSKVVLLTFVKELKSPKHPSLLYDFPPSIFNDVWTLNMHGFFLDLF